MPLSLTHMNAHIQPDMHNDHKAPALDHSGGLMLMTGSVAELNCTAGPSCPAQLQHMTERRKRRIRRETNMVKTGKVDQRMQQRKPVMD